MILLLHMEIILFWHGKFKIERSHLCIACNKSDEQNTELAFYHAMHYQHVFRQMLLYHEAMIHFLFFLPNSKSMAAVSQLQVIGMEYA